MSVRLYQQLSQLSTVFETKLLKHWQDLADSATELIEKIHITTRALLEENASLQKENSATSSYLQQKKTSHLSLINSLEEHITLLEQEKTKLSKFIAEMDAPTDGRVLYGGCRSFAEYKRILELFIEYSKIHTHGSGTTYLTIGIESSEPLYRRH